MHKLSLHHSAQRGDTIVEVLIAMAVASSVLALTYVTMNRNLNITRASQERTEASKVVQGQIEALKARTDAGRTLVSDNFCIDATDGSEIELPPGIPNTTGSTPAARLAADDFSKYINPLGVTEDCVSSGLYHYGAILVSGTTYRFYVRWERVGGGGREEIIMVYSL
ncbi:hypothetical protein BH10PAT3_BH10PAT3_8260 [soil metagenome]